MLVGYWKYWREHFVKCVGLHLILNLEHRVGMQNTGIERKCSSHGQLLKSINISKTKEPSGARWPDSLYICVDDVFILLQNGCFLNRILSGT